MAEKTNSRDIVVSNIAAGAAGTETVKAPCFTAEFECVGADGLPKWKSSMHNVVMNGGKAEILNRFFGQKANAPWYLGLASSAAASATTNAGLLMTNMSASEVTGYGASRPNITFISNNAATVTQVSQSASYGITVAGPVNVGGAFICGDQGTTAGAGILYSFGTFASRGLVSNDTLNVSVSVQYA